MILLIALSGGLSSPNDLEGVSKPEVEAQFHVNKILFETSSFDCGLDDYVSTSAQDEKIM